MFYVLAYQLSTGKKALAYNDGLPGSEDLEQAKKLIPNWNGYHAAGATWSTSATLYWMSFQPCLISIESIEQAETMIVERKVTTENNVWGSAGYIILKDDAPFNIAFERKLIDEKVSQAKPFWEPAVVVE